MQDGSGRASILGIPIYTFGGNRIRINDNTYDLNPEKREALSSTSYTDRTMKNENDILMIDNIGDLGYTGIGERSANRKTFFTTKLPRLVKDIQSKTFDEFIDNSDNDLQGGGVKIIILSNIIDIYTSFEKLLELKISGHTDTLTEGSNLIDELNKRGESKNEQQFRDAPDKFHTKYMELPSKKLEQIAFNTRPKIEEQKIIVTDKSTHEEHLSQPLQTIKKQFKMAVTISTGSGGIFVLIQTKILSFISQNQSTVIILMLFQFHPAHMNSRV